MGYEDARAELSDVVRRLESGGQTLEESLALWLRGEELAKICERWLSGATDRLRTRSLRRTRRVQLPRILTSPLQTTAHARPERPAFLEKMAGLGIRQP